MSPTLRPGGEATCSLAASEADPGLPHWQVPVVPMGNLGSQDECKQKEIFLRLQELLSLQVSIAVSLNLASLAFRDTDVQLASAMRETHLQALDELTHGANVISRFADYAHWVSENVLKDILFAVEQRQPTVAVALLNTISTDKMRQDEADISVRYARLQESVSGLIRKVQYAKRLADRRLVEAASCAAEGASAAAAGGAAAEAERLALEAAAASLSTALAQVPAPPGGPAQQLVRRLRALAAENPLPAGARQLEGWRRDMLDLFFVEAPEAEPPPPPERLAPTEGRAQPGSRELARAPAPSLGILNRVLRQLRRADAILRGCSSFWANMEGTVDVLARMKEHTVTLANFTDYNTEFRGRLVSRLNQYTVFWSSLERVCRRYCDDYRAMSESMDRWMQKFEDATDLAGALQARSSWRAGAGGADV